MLKLTWLLWLGFGLVSSATSVSAALGNSRDMIGSTNVSAAGKVITYFSGKSYSVHSYTDRTGVNIKEFSRADGMIFAVSWYGPSLPDMRDLLGSYFNEYTQYLSAQKSRKYVAANLVHLVFKSTGGARFFAGHAYAPFLIPGDFESKDFE